MISIILHKKNKTKQNKTKQKKTSECFFLKKETFGRKYIESGHGACVKLHVKNINQPF